MFKKSIIAIIVLLYAMTLMASSEYYYRYDEKIYLTQVPGEMGFVQSPIQLKNNIIPKEIISKGYLASVNKYHQLIEFKQLSDAEISLLKKNGKLLPAYKIKGAEHARYLSGDLYIKTKKDLTNDQLDKLLHSQGLTLIKQIRNVDNWYLVSTNENPVTVARAIKEHNIVKYAEPAFYTEFVTYAPHFPNDPIFKKQWHLYNDGTQGVNGTDSSKLPDAWGIMKAAGQSNPGSGITISIIDNGFDVEHEDLKGKIKAYQDFGGNSNKPIYVDGPGGCDGNGGPTCHGTACAGVAAGHTDNGIGIAGACPGCDLIVARMNMTANVTMADFEQTVIDTFNFSIDNSADVVSCSWGPNPLSEYVIPAVILDLMQKMTAEGRDGKGMVVLFAAGNGNPMTGQALDITSNPYASSEYTIGIGATNSQGIKSSYSNFGAKLDVVAPSNDMGQSGFIDGIWTTDITGPNGYSAGGADGWGASEPPPSDETGNYSSGFGGTSSATPLTAGVAGLILAANPELYWNEVRDILRDTADKVNEGIAQYDASGHSLEYGYGRVNAGAAVTKAIELAGGTVPETPDEEPVETNDDSEEIPDIDTTQQQSDNTESPDTTDNPDNPDNPDSPDNPDNPDNPGTPNNQKEIIEDDGCSILLI